MGKEAGHKFCRALVTASVCRKVRTLELADLVHNCLGCLLLLANPFFFQGNQAFFQSLELIFTFLVFSQLNIYLSIKYWKFREKQEESYMTLQFRSGCIAVIKNLCTFRNWPEALRLLLILVQPNVLLPLQWNRHFSYIAPFRVYAIIRFWFLTKEFSDPAFDRICSHFGVDPHLQAVKTLFTPKYFLASIVGIFIVVLVGFGNLIKAEEVVTFGDIYQATYFIFTTMSTVGYGDYSPKSLIDRTLTVVVLITGVVIFSILSYKVLSGSGLNQQQSNTLHTINKLRNGQMKNQILSQSLIRLLNMKAMMKQLTQLQTQLDKPEDLAHIHVNIDDRTQGIQTKDQPKSARKLSDSSRLFNARFESIIDNPTQRQKAVIRSNPLYLKTIVEYNRAREEQIQEVADESYRLGSSCSVVNLDDRLKKLRSQFLIFNTSNDMVMKNARRILSPIGQGGHSLILPHVSH